ncbi:50S ribosomal protein L24 [Candidatus Saccharibacteria bacterium]|nr:50S ribosomal protein L24 [Candidatus Saccharibacteria bacterium]
MKLKLDDKVMVISGRDKGKIGKITRILPKTGKIVIEGINQAKKHQKAQGKLKAGLVDINIPLDPSKVMAIDPKTSRVSRIGYKVMEGKKTRVFVVSRFTNAKAKSVKKAEIKPNKTKEIQ